MNARLFAALQPPPALAAQLFARATEILEVCAGELRCYAAEELHMTLWFIGARPRAEIDALAEALAKETHALRAPRLLLRGAGAFPSLAQPRVVWAGAEEEPAAAGRLVALASAAARALGGELELPFRAHLTLARPRGASRPRLPAELAHLALPGIWEAAELVLFESLPDARPRYLPRARLPLVP